MLQQLEYPRDSKRRILGSLGNFVGMILWIMYDTRLGMPAARESHVFLPLNDLVARNERLRKTSRTGDTNELWDPFFL